VLPAFEPEELAPVIFNLARGRAANGVLLHAQSVASDVSGSFAAETTYSGVKSDAAALVVQEAWEWLK
jgi:hypothetical protein